ncbi:condensin complex subunit 3 [Drosophila eugracilis]|uniref:condensin complex subunit 3 n=1 Tax=Drosophila eugracilis TaxID=29029 RepID=UPI0007E5FC36|nr:condensin complex subunit 3 [Drosophila eugracilis]
MARPKGKAGEKEKETAKPKATVGRKRQATTKNKSNKDVEKENKEATSSNATTNPSSSPELMYSIMRQAELKESMHKRYVKEMQQLYTKMGHEPFRQAFINVLKAVLEAEEGNENANMALNFCATFVASPDSESEPMLGETFRWLLTTYSSSPHIRYRICYFVNLILKELGPNAALDDKQCDEILDAMLERVKDVSASVRKQAVLAMQRLQNPDNPNDLVVCAYQYHLTSDPSANVRQCIITCMGRNYITIPHILQRLWDVDEKVRRHTYVNMCNYPVRSYKVAQRLTLLEQGLNDTSATVRKTVINYMLKSWIESYQQNYIALTAALKLDSNEEELLRFRRVAKQMLRVIFDQTDHQKLIEQLPLSDDCELHRCIPHELLTVELLIYWQCLSEYLETEAPEMESVLPELSVFCKYMEKFCQFQKPDMDKFAQVEFQNMLLSLVEILESYDLGDEIGRGNMRLLIANLLKDCLLDHKIVSVLVRCMEQLITDVNDRMQFFIEIIYELCELNTKQNELIHDRSLINKLLDDLDTPLKMKISSLKVKILEMEEQEDNYVRQKEYMRAQSINDEKTAVTEEYTELIRPLLERNGVLEVPARPKLSKQERVLKGLYTCYYMTASPHVNKLTPSLCQLYKDFICRYLPSAEVDIFEWAIKCGTTYSMFYEAYCKEVFEVVVVQFFNNNVVRLCETAANCMMELLDRYGIDYFNDLNQTGGQASKTKRRQLYTMQEVYDDDDGSQSQNNEQNTDIIMVMGHYLERVQNKGVGLAIVRGLCRLVLRGHLDDRTDVLEQLLKRYFNPNTEPMISQVLGMFFEELRRLNKQSLLQPCFLPTVWTIMNCSFDSPLSGVAPENLTKFFLEMTVQEISTPQTNIHNKIAISFLQYIQNYFTERKEMCRLLSKELTSLSVNVFNGPEIKTEMLQLADKLIASELDPRMIKNIDNFKMMVNGSFNPPPRRNPGEGDSDEECETATVTTAAESETAVPAETTEPAPESSSSNEPALISGPQTQQNELIEENTAATPKAAEPAAPTPEPIITTYGKDNIVGIRYLRRSMAISQSEAESLLGPQSPNPEENTETEAAETSKRNLRQPQMRKRLEMAIARSSKTPEKRPSSGEESSDEEITESPTAENKSNDSEVIEASPTAASPSPKNAPDASHLRIRSLRNRTAASTSVSQPTSTPVSKRKILHLETPLRNGRKRVLRRTPSDPKSRSLRSTDPSAPSPPHESPLRKQQRLDNRSSRRQQMVKNTNSPTDSTSSVKENEVPSATINLADSESDAVSESESESEPEPRPTKSKKPISKTISLIRSRPSSSTPKVTTRNDARAQRINSMCMTRKRMSLEMNLSGGQLQVSTPKRVTRAVALSMSMDGKRGRRK